MSTLNVFHKAGIVFALIAFFLFLAYFILGAGSVSITSESAGRRRWRNALSWIWKIAMILAILAFAGLLPRSFVVYADRILQGVLNLVRPVVDMIPGLKGLL